MANVYVVQRICSYTRGPYYGPETSSEIRSVYATRELAFEAITEDCERYFGCHIDELDREVYNVDCCEWFINIEDTLADGDSTGWFISKHDFIES